MNCEDKGVRNHIVYKAFVERVRWFDALGDLNASVSAKISPRIITNGVSSFVNEDKINGVDWGIIIQFKPAPAIIAALARLMVGVVSSFVSFSKLIKGLLKFCVIILARVIRMEYAVVRRVAVRIIIRTKVFVLWNKADSIIRSLE